MVDGGGFDICDGEDDEMVIVDDGDCEMGGGKSK